MDLVKRVFVLELFEETSIEGIKDRRNWIFTVDFDFKCKNTAKSSVKLNRRLMAHPEGENSSFFYFIECRKGQNTK